jgi:UDP-N-acetyl-D-galactosamine dehydrogenase
MAEAYPGRLPKGTALRYTPPMSGKPVIAIVGLGYVGLPLGNAFAKAGYRVIGFDVSEMRVSELKEGRDRTDELTGDDLKAGPLEYTTDPASMKEADVIILAIPTPVDENFNPDLALVRLASKTVGENLKKGAIVVYESTVYPGVTEEICGPILEEASGMTCGVDFFLGYSPERINPGDKQHTVTSIIKIVSGQDDATLKTLSALYGAIVKAGIHEAPSIKVAEMAKAIENAQRDLNIAYVNEVALLCNKLGIRTKDVLEAAGTKWNFLKFQPGLVGGHCIGVDPYYLVERAKQLGMVTQVITAGRATNEGMGPFVAEQTIAGLNVPAKDAKALVIGLTFKENVPDTRNSKSHDVIAALKNAGVTVEVHDAYVDDTQIAKYGYAKGELTKGGYDAILFLVNHDAYKDVDFAAALKEGGVFYDLKSVRDPKAFTGRTYKSL